MAQTITMNDVYRTLIEIKQKMVSKEELANLLETLEILHNPKTMQQLRESEKDIRSGKTKAIHSMKDILAEIE